MKSDNEMFLIICDVTCDVLRIDKLYGEYCLAVTQFD